MTDTISRRGFAAALGATAAALAAPAQAYRRCEARMTPVGPARLCEVGLELRRMDFAPQGMSQWCWAASVSNLFEWYGFDLPQEEIVEAIWGRVVNLPAMSTVQISRALDREWTDSEGRRFRSRIRAVYDAMIGTAAIDNLMILRALADERPMLYCNTSHAMVLTAAAYVETPAGPNVVNLGFFDPWPGRGLRGPDGPHEMLPRHAGGAITYIALPEVREI